MERYYNDDSDKDQEPFFGSGDDNDEDPEETEEALAFMQRQNVIDVMQIELAQIELNQKLLAQAVAIAEQEWLWWMRGVGYKTAQIEAVYKRLVQITEDAGGEQVEETE